VLLAGEIVNRASLAQMQRTVPVISFEGKKIDYGLGLHKIEVPGQAAEPAARQNLARPLHRISLGPKS
jgi:hypothetical protein